MLHIGKRRKDLLGRVPVERTHREIVVFSVPDGKLFLEVLKGIELVRSIEILIVFAVATLDLTVVTRREDFNDARPYRCDEA